MNTTDTKPASDTSSAILNFLFRNSLFHFTLAILLIVGAVVGTVYLARERPELLGVNSSRQESDQQEVTTIIEEVSKIYELPEGEVPIMRIVDDINDVKRQEFFKNAQNGDVILVYTNAKEAIIYRPNDKKIIEVGVVNINEESQGDVAGESEEANTQQPNIIVNPETNPQNSSTPTIIP